MDPVFRQIIQKQVLLDDLKKRENMLQAMYMHEAGMLEYERLKLYFECRRLQREMEISKTYKDSGLSITDDLIHSMSSIDTSGDRKALAHKLMQVEQARAMLNMLKNPPADYSLMKNMYSEILARLYNDKKGFNLARRAYLENDYALLEKLYIEASALPEESGNASLEDLVKLTGEISSLLEGYWLMQEETLLDEQKRADLMQPLHDDCQFYEEVKTQLLDMQRKASI